jgi:hypothetical protein
MSLVGAWRGLVRIDMTHTQDVSDPPLRLRSRAHPRRHNPNGRNEGVNRMIAVVTDTAHVQLHY